MFLNIIVKECVQVRTHVSFNLGFYFIIFCVLSHREWTLQLRLLPVISHSVLLLVEQSGAEVEPSFLCLCLLFFENSFPSTFSGSSLSSDLTCSLASILSSRILSQAHSFRQCHGLLGDTVVFQFYDGNIHGPYKQYPFLPLKLTIFCLQICIYMTKEGLHVS